MKDMLWIIDISTQYEGFGVEGLAQELDTTTAPGQKVGLNFPFCLDGD